MTYNVEDMLFLLLSLDKVSYSQYVVDHLSYSAVGELCSKAVDDGLIIEYREKYQLTKKGKDFLLEQNKNLHKKGINQFIANLPDAYRPKIKIDDIYIPEKI